MKETRRHSKKRWGSKRRRSESGSATEREKQKQGRKEEIEINWAKKEVNNTQSSIREENARENNSAKVGESDKD